MRGVKTYITIKTATWLRGLMVICAIMLAATAQAQEDDEYLMEVGGGGGIIGYLGDFNGSLTKCLQPAAGLTAKYKFNPRMAVAVDATYGKLKGGSSNTTTYYPDYVNEPYEFNNNLVDAGARFEFNFLPYGTGNDYRGAKRLVPYTTLGIGATYVWGQDAKTIFTANIPVGFGVKYKAANRLNVTLQWTVHFSLSDQLDGRRDPYQVYSEGLFKNTDCYHRLMVTLTYDIWAKCRICNNNDD